MQRTILHFNDAITKWRELKEELKLANDGTTVVYHLLSTVEHSH